MSDDIEGMTREQAIQALETAVATRDKHGLVFKLGLASSALYDSRQETLRLRRENRGLRAKLAHFEGEGTK